MKITSFCRALVLTISSRKYGERAETIETCPSIISYKIKRTSHNSLNLDILVQDNTRTMIDIINNIGTIKTSHNSLILVQDNKRTVFGLLKIGAQIVLETTKK